MAPAVLLGLMFTPLAASGYSLRELGVLAQGGVVAVRGLNDAGEVVGSGIIAGGPRAFVVNEERLRIIHPGAASDYSVAHGINGAGVVVGSMNGTSAVRAFRWTATQGIIELQPLPGDTASEAFAVTLSGDAVGLSAGAAAGTRAVRWSQTGAISALEGLPGASESRAVAINQAGTAVGVSADRAVAWSGDTVTALGELRGDDRSEALSINASGHIVGSSGHLATRRAVRWVPGFTPQDLGVLSGGVSSRALSINDRGEIVGTSDSVLGNRAVLWTATTGPRDLNDLVTGLTGVILTSAVAINNRGDIAALGRDDNGHGHDAQEHSTRVFLLLAVP
jgi:uncharacterized membrane protein